MGDKLRKEVFQYTLASLIVLGFFIVLSVMIYQNVKENAIMNAMVGTLGAITTMIASYFFGSSKSNDDKNETNTTK